MRKWTYKTLEKLFVIGQLIFHRKYTSFHPVCRVPSVTYCPFNI